MMATTEQNLAQTATKTPATAQRTYGKIVLTLYTCLLPENMLKETPSQTDGVDIETETDLRILACEMIQTAGILLKLPQVAMATGQIYLQRFYYSKSFVRYPMETLAMGSIYLAAKVEEKPCRIRDVINVFHHIKQVRAQKYITPLIVDKNYTELENQVIMAERRILKELGFSVHVKHPHKLIVVYLQLLQCEKNRQLMQMALNYINDALRTDVYMRFSPETIACACIYLTARKIGLPLPNKPHWFLLLNVPEKDIRQVCVRILQLYNRTKVNPEELEVKVDILRKAYQTSKHIQAQNERENNKAEEKKVESPPSSTSTTEEKKIELSSSSNSSKESNQRDSKNDESPKAPPLPSKYRGSHKSRKEHRSRGPYARDSYFRSSSSRRHKSRSRDREMDRSRNRRRVDDKRGRVISGNYEDYERATSPSRDREMDRSREQSSIDDKRGRVMSRNYEDYERATSRSRDREMDRSRERSRMDDKRGRVMSRNYEDYKRATSPSRDREMDRSRERSRMDDKRGRVMSRNYEDDERATSRSRNREMDRSRERSRMDDKRGRVMSRNYENYERATSRTRDREIDRSRERRRMDDKGDRRMSQKSDDYYERYKSSRRC